MSCAQKTTRHTINYQNAPEIVVPQWEAGNVFSQTPLQLGLGKVTQLSKQNAPCDLEAGSLEKAPHRSSLVRGHRDTWLPDGIKTGGCGAGVWALPQGPQEQGHHT